MNAPGALRDCLAKQKAIRDLIESTVDLGGAHIRVLSKVVVVLLLVSLQASAMDCRDATPLFVVTAGINLELNRGYIDKFHRIIFYFPGGTTGTEGTAKDNYFLERSGCGSGFGKIHGNSNRPVAYLCKSARLERGGWLEARRSLLHVRVYSLYFVRN